jgi:Na+-driven multidrug efflux pump
MPEAARGASSHPLATGDVRRLLLKFAIPSIVSMLVGALYNMVDQVFIGWRVGVLGNAATNVAFPLVTLSMSVSLLFARGGASNFNLELGRGNKERAGRIVANAVVLSAICGTAICVAARAFLEPMLWAFGATEDVMPYAISYTGITSLGIPFMTMSLCASHLMRADGSPRHAMFCNLSGAILNTILDPIFMFWLDMGIEGAAIATVVSIIVSWCLAASYMINFRSVRLLKNYFVPRLRELRAIAALGAEAGFNQIAMMCVQMTMNNVMASYGAFSTYGANIPLAASGIITKVNMIFMSIVIGIAQGGHR